MVVIQLIHSPDIYQPSLRPTPPPRPLASCLHCSIIWEEGRKVTDAKESKFLPPTLPFSLYKTSISLSSRAIDWILLSGRLVLPCTLSWSQWKAGQWSVCGSLYCNLHCTRHEPEGPGQSLLSLVLKSSRPSTGSTRRTKFHRSFNSFLKKLNPTAHMPPGRTPESCIVGIMAP